MLCPDRVSMCVSNRHAGAKSVGIFLISPENILTLTTIWADLADPKIDDIFLIFPRKLTLTFNSNRFFRRQIE